MKGVIFLKTIKVQVSHSCEKCRFNIPKEEVSYCLAFLKPLCIDEKTGELIPVLDCKESEKENI